MELLKLSTRGITSPRIVEYGVVIRASIEDDEWDDLLASEENQEVPCFLKGFADATGEFGRKGIDEQNMRFEFVASAKTVDRDGDVILPDAFKTGFSAYKNNPVIPWAHDIRFPPVAKASNFIWTEDIFGATATFGKTPFAMEVFSLYKDGVMNAFSVGFLSVAVDREPVLPKQTGVTFTKVDLLEISSVVVPSNREALIQRGSGHVRGLAKAIRDIPGDTLETQARIRSAAERFGLDDLDARSFVSLDIQDWLPELSEEGQADVAGTGADGDPQEGVPGESGEITTEVKEQREEERMFKLYTIPKDAVEALSNLFARHGIKLEDEEQVESFLGECVEVVRVFEPEDESVRDIPASIVRELRSIVSLVPEVRSVLDKVEGSIKLALGEAAEGVEGVEEGDGTDADAEGEAELDAALEAEAEAEEVEEAEAEEDVEEEPKFTLSDEDKETALTDVQVQLTAVLADENLTDEEREAEAVRLRGLLEAAGIELEAAA